MAGNTFFCRAVHEAKGPESFRLFEDSCTILIASTIVATESDFISVAIRSATPELVPTPEEEWRQRVPK